MKNKLYKIIKICLIGCLSSLLFSEESYDTTKYYGPIIAINVPETEYNIAIVYDVRTTKMDTDKPSADADVIRLLQVLDDDDDDEYAAMQSGGGDNNKFLLSIKERKDLIRDEDCLSSIFCSFSLSILSLSSSFIFYKIYFL